METHTKLLAFGLIALIICHSCGIMGALGFQRAFADAAPETYTASNIIYLNATGLDRSPHIIRLEISEQFKDPYTLPIKVGGIGGDGFAPNATIDTSKLVDVYSRQSTGPLSIFGYTANTTGAQIANGFIFNDEFVFINSSDWVSAGFNQIPISYPAIEKEVFFKSPLDYALTFCRENGYALNSIINSTYYHEYDMDTLNAFQSKLVKVDCAVIYYNLSEVYADEFMNLNKFGGALVSPEDLKLTGAEWYLIAKIIALGIVLVIALITFVLPVIQQALHNQALLDGLNALNRANGDKLTEAINATKNLADHMLADKNAQRLLVMNFYANGTIDWSQLQYLLQQIDASYNGLINNCTFNIAAMLASYYNTTLGLYDKYAAGLDLWASWSNWIYDIIILAVSLLAIYFVYTLIAKFRSPRAPAGSITIVR
jgi:hypothetical protein